MAESVSRSRKAPVAAEKKGEWVPHDSATAPGHHREDLTTPPFSIQELRDCIPAHCFEKSNLTSFTYLAVDIAIVTALTTLGAFVHFELSLPWYIAMVFWSVFAFVQGTVMTGIWVLAHEAGHSAFSPQVWVNDVVGWTFHSLLLVPYFSWKYTHASHHLHTNHMSKDEVHVPPTSHEMEGKMPWTKFRIALSIFKHLVFGWPFYLAQNVASNKQWKAYKNANHFSPWSPLFTEEQRPFIVLSDVGVGMTVALLSFLSYKFGTPAVALLYGGPYLIVNMWLVLITKLQHTANDVPVYDTDTFTWVKGQLCTVDRSYGWILNVALHHIQDTHVAHHLFSKMPHYHAEEATVHLKKKLGKYYRHRDASVVTQCLEVFGECVYVAEKNGVWWYPTIGDDLTELWTPQ